MGGTTVKACLIENGAAAETNEGEVGAGMNTAGHLFKGSGYALRVPAYDIVELGAGGGSIARIEEGLLMRVGPQSAGAVPGPACYGRGGTQPTVTDANVVLGYMNPDRIAGGTVAIDAGARARRNRYASRTPPRIGSGGGCPRRASCSQRHHGPGDPLGYQ